MTIHTEPVPYAWQSFRLDGPAAERLLSNLNDLAIDIDDRTRGGFVSVRVDTVDGHIAASGPIQDPQLVREFIANLS